MEKYKKKNQRKVVKKRDYPMKYSKVIFLLTVMLLAFPSSSIAAPCNDTKQREYTISECGLENEISEFADELRKYRSVQTQSTEHNAIKRNCKQQTNKRISDNKSGALHHSAQNHKNQDHLSVSCHKAVVTARHSRGYYIYALRHIII